MSKSVSSGCRTTTRGHSSQPGLGLPWTTFHICRRLRAVGTGCSRYSAALRDRQKHVPRHWIDPILHRCLIITFARILSQIASFSIVAKVVLSHRAIEPSNEERPSTQSGSQLQESISAQPHCSVRTKRRRHTVPLNLFSVNFCRMLEGAE